MNKVDEILEHVAEFGVDGKTRIVPHVIKEAKKELCEALLEHFGEKVYYYSEAPIKSFFGQK